MGYRFKTVDCGVTVRLPDNTWEWILFKSRHVGAVSWAREYVKTKLPDKETVEHISKTDYQYTANIFLKTLLGTNPLTILVFTAITLASLLPLEDKHKWRRLKSTKLYFFYLLGATPWG